MPTFSTAGLTAGTYKLFAQAEDSYGVFGDGVGGAGAGDGAGGGGLADGAGDRAVGAGAAVRDRPQRLPDAPLEGGGLDVEGQVEVKLPAVEVPEQHVRPRVEPRVVAPHLG